MNPVAPELIVSQWKNCQGSSPPQNLKGKVTLIYAFQMLCAGCVYHGLPFVNSINMVTRADDFQIIGLHSVFENHVAMGPEALEVFIKEFRVGFPVAVDQPSKDLPLPQTMLAYNMRGTPTYILIDRNQRIRAHYFGAVDHDRMIGEINQLLAESDSVHST